MERFLVTSQHTLEDCRLAVEHFAKYNAGFLTHFEWGCFDGDHNAYAFIEADTREQALLAVPPFLRQKAKAVKVTELSPKIIAQKMHDQKG